MRALVLGNDGDNSSGLIGERAEFHGYRLEPLLRERHGEWPTLDGVDLVMSLGSEWSVYWDHVQPHVQPEIALLQEAARRDIAVFGICFGSQLLAEAHGGKVTRAPQAEIGWVQVQATVAGADLIEPGPWFQWHYDRWALPPGATLLAKNANANQAFLLGRSFATQFHPELTESMLTHWLEMGGAEAATKDGLDPEAMLASTRTSTGEARDRAATLFDCFLKDVIG